MTATVTKNGKDKTYTISDGDGKINVSLAKGNTYLDFTDRELKDILSLLGEDYTTPDAEDLKTNYIQGKKIVVKYGTADNDTITLPKLSYDKDPKIYIKTKGDSGYENLSNIFESVSYDLGEYIKKGKYYYYNSYSGTVFNDSITTSHNHSNVTIKGGYGDDTISGGEKNDKLYGGEGNDSILGGDGNDYIDGGNGQNIIYGEDGNDTIKVGNSDNNVLNGGEGNDVISAGKGTENTITDDEGNNTITVVGTAENVKKGIVASNNTITTGDGNDIIKVSNGNYTINGGGGYDTLNLGSGENTVIMYEGTFNNTFVNTNSKGKNIYQFSSALENYTFVKYASNKNIIDEDNNNKKHGTITTNDLVIYKNGEEDYDFLVIKNYFKSNSNADKTYFQFNGGDIKSVTEMGENFVITLTPADTTKKSTINGTVYNDSITGGDNNDVLKGGNGNDTIEGGAGDDKLYGGAGNNKYIFSDDFGKDIIYEEKQNATNLICIDSVAENPVGKSGNDLIIYRDEDNYVTVKDYYSNVKNKTTYNIKIGEDETKSLADYLSGLEVEISGSGKIVGTDSNDNITVIGNKAVTITGNKGNDTIGYAKGNRTMYFYSGDGNDTVEAGGGVDTFKFEKGANVTTEFEYNTDGTKNLIFRYGNNDSVFLENYDEKKKLYYYEGNKKYTLGKDDAGEYIKITEYATHYDGTEGNDTIMDALVHNSENPITINGKQGDDYIDAHHDKVYAGEGNDYVHVLDSFVYGEDGNDVIIDYGSSSSTKVELYGGNGDDTIISENHGTIEKINGGDGNDSITIKENANVTNIDSGNDNDSIIISGTVKNIDGNEGNDTITVENTGNVTDTLNGGAGDNVISISGTVSQITVGEGNNSITLNKTANISNNIITNSGNDTIDIYNNSSLNINSGSGNDSISISGTVKNVDGNDGNDTITVENTGNVTGTLNSGNDNDSISISGTVKNIDGNSGNDTIIVENTGNVTGTLNGGNDNDSIIISGTVNNINGNEGTDTITVENTGNVTNSINGGNDNDSIIISGTVNNIDGNEGNDTITVESTGKVTGTIDGGNGNDSITVSGNVSCIRGNNGDDTITITSTGNVTDTIIGGTGNDTYIFYSGSGEKHISDYSGNNTIIFTDIKFSDLDFRGENTLIIIENKNNTNDKVYIENSQFSHITKIKALNDNNELVEIPKEDCGLNIVISENVNNIYGNESNDTITVTNTGKVTGTLYGGEGNDSIIISGTVNNIDGNEGNDTITVENTGNVTGSIDSGYGNDSIIIEGTAKNINGTEGNDTITVTSTGKVTDTLNGGTGDNVISVSGTVGQITVGEGNNSITLNKTAIISTNDITTNSGNDTIDIYNNSSLLYVNSCSGNDSITIQENASIGTVYSGEGNDTITVTSTGKVTEAIESGDGDDSIIIEGNTNVIFDYTGNNTITVTSTGNVTGYIQGGDGDDSITIEGNAKTIYGDEGNDTITVTSTGNVIDTINGGLGDDTYIFYSGSGEKHVYDGNGDNIIVFADTKFSNLYAYTENDYFIIEDKTNENDKVYQNKSSYINKIVALDENGELIEYTINSVGEKITITNSVQNVDGGNGNDTIAITSTGNVTGTLNGGAGDDSIIISGTVYNINDNNGNDTIIVENSGNVTNYINSGEGNDSITISGTVNNINGYSGNDTITVTNTGKVTGTINGYYGDDTYIFYSGSGEKHISDNSGNNTIVFADTKYSNLYAYTENDYFIIEDMTNENDKVSCPISSIVIIKALDENNELQEYKFKLPGKDIAVTHNTYGIQGCTIWDDTITVTNYATVECDLIANGGNDKIYIEQGCNIANIWGDDNYFESHKFDGNDIITVAGTCHVIRGCGGNDIITVKQNSGIASDIYGGGGSDKIILEKNTTADRIYGDHFGVLEDAGDDEIIVAGRASSIDGNEGNDTITVENTGNVTGISGWNGNDLLTVSGTVTSINGDAGNDTITVEYTGEVTGTIYGGEGNDLINVMSTGKVTGSIYGEGGDDYLAGGNGNNILSGGTGNDTIYGGAGNDTIIFSQGDGNDTLYSTINCANYDTIKFNDVSISEITPEALNEHLILNYGEGDSVTIDKAYAFSSYTTIIDKNNDTISIYDLYYDNLKLGTTGNDSIFGDTTNDAICGLWGDDSIVGSSRNDIINAGDGNDTVISGNGDDWIDAWNGNDSIDGGMGNDTIYGAAGDDTIYAGKGDDVVIGGTGLNEVYGGEGNDTYINVPASNYDLIYDESGDNDQIVMDKTNKSEIILSFDLQIDDSGNILDYVSKNLYITPKDNLGDANIGIKVTDYFDEGHEIETITTADNYIATTSSINAIRQDVAGWLKTNSYDSVQEAIDSGNDISALVAIFDSAWKQGS